MGKDLSKEAMRSELYSLVHRYNSTLRPIDCDRGNHGQVRK